MEPLRIIAGRLREIAYSTIAQLPQITFAILVLVATWVLARSGRTLAERGARRSRLRPELVELAGNLTALGIWVAGLLIGATVAFPGMTPSNLLAGIGIGSVAIGFAFKDVFENFLAGILILYREPMRIGDVIECEGIEGRVERISIRDSSIRQTDGQLVVVPNATLFKNPVRVLTSRPQRRTTVICGVGYGCDLERARAVMTRAVEGCETVARGPGHPIQIFAQAFGESAIDFEMTWWTGSTPVQVRTSRDEVVRAVKRALDEAGIEIPFPHRTLVMNGPVRLEGGGAGERRPANGGRRDGADAGEPPPRA